MNPRSYYDRNKPRVILDLCAGTGSWSRPYQEANYDVRVVTLPESDVLSYVPPVNVYGILAAPPCTVFSKACWNVKKQNRRFSDGMKIVRACLNIIWKVQEKGAPLTFWALENPLGYLYNFLGKPAFYFQPWQFGDKTFLATKRTAIWGYFNQPVKPVRTRNIPFINSHAHSKPTRSRSKRLSENKEWYSASRNKRSITTPGFARAFYEVNK